MSKDSKKTGQLSYVLDQAVDMMTGMVERDISPAEADGYAAMLRAYAQVHAVQHRRQEQAIQHKFGKSGARRMGVFTLRELQKD